MKISRFKRMTGYLLLCLTSAAVRWDGSAVGQQVSQLLEQSWTPGGEHRHQSIFAMVQTHDGYLWLGTDKGLSRFDGVRFTDFTAPNTPGMGKGSIAFAAMWEDLSGRLWAGTTGNGVVFYDHGRFSTLTTREGLPNNSILRIDGDETGTVWIYTAQGVCRWQDGTVEARPPELDDVDASLDLSGSSGDMTHLGLWRKNSTGAVERFAYGHWREFPLPDRPVSNEPLEIRSIYEDSLHRVWYSFYSQPTDFYIVEDGKLTDYANLPRSSFVFYRDAEGFLWIADHESHTVRWKNGISYPLPSLSTLF